MSSGYGALVGDFSRQVLRRDADRCRIRRYDRQFIV